MTDKEQEPHNEIPIYNTVSVGEDLEAEIENLNRICDDYLHTLKSGQQQVDEVLQIASRMESTEMDNDQYLIEAERKISILEADESLDCQFEYLRLFQLQVGQMVEDFASENQEYHENLLSGVKGYIP